MKEISVLFLPVYGPAGPSSRLRVYQYLEPLKRMGVIPDLVAPPRRGGRPARLVYLGRVLARARRAEVVFLQKQTLAWGLGALVRINPRLVYDFDDAVFAPPPWERFSGSAREERLRRVLKRSRAVVAGNDYLADYAREYCPQVSVIPTGVNPDEISRQVSGRERKEQENGKTVIGWTGTRENLWYLESLRSLFPRLFRRFGEGVAFRVISNGSFAAAGIPVENCSWSLREEYVQLSGLDIGWAPLGDDPWSRGKCGFKAVQYMALGVSPVASRTGVYPEIISEGENGFLAREQKEWEEKTSRLIREPDLRRKIGAAARETIREKYSRERILPRLAGVIELAARS